MQRPREQSRLEQEGVGENISLSYTPSCKLTGSQTLRQQLLKYACILPSGRALGAGCFCLLLLWWVWEGSQVGTISFFTTLLWAPEHQPHWPPERDHQGVHPLGDGLKSAGARCVYKLLPRRHWWFDVGYGKNVEIGSARRISICP